jgi:hypothetical protein
MKQVGWSVFGKAQYLLRLSKNPLLKKIFSAGSEFLSLFDKGNFIVAIFGKLSLFCHLGY